MSGDFEAAIRFGATHVRVGTAIFGARPRGAAERRTATSRHRTGGLPERFCGTCLSRPVKPGTPGPVGRSSRAC